MSGWSDVYSLISKKKKEVFLLTAFSVFPFLSGSLFLFLVYYFRVQLALFSGTNWLMIFLVLSIPISISLIPNTLAGLVSGYFLGWWALPGMTLSFSLACLLGFEIGKFTGSGMLQDVALGWPAVGGLMNRFREKPLSLVMGLRLLPAPPFAVSSLLLSWLKVPFWSYFSGSIAGMLPRMTLVVLLGSLAGSLQELFSQSVKDIRLLISIGMMALLGFLLIYLRFFYRKKSPINSG